MNKQTRVKALRLACIGFAVVAAAGGGGVEALLVGAGVAALLPHFA